MPPFLTNLLIGIFFTALSLLFVKPQQGPIAATIDEFNVRKDEGADLIYGGGTFWHEVQPHAYGDLKTIAIKSKTGKK